jgi:ABC-type multidrug transport system fused ATPase/permease subunit
MSASGELSPTLVAPAAFLAAFAFGPIGRATGALQSLREAEAAGARVFALLDARTPAPGEAHPARPAEAPPVQPARPAEARPAEAPRAPSPARPDVRFCDVRFRYGPNLPDALSGATFTLAAGETTVLVGQSGAGKTTCANLLLRFWPQQAGTILVNGMDIGGLPESELRPLVGLVGQDIYLFNTSVHENLCLGRPGATDSEIEDALAAAAASEFTHALPAGLETRIGERGARLSGGERQRLAVARALLADPPLLVLDEPVSNLDADNERSLSEAMRRLRAGRTTLLIGHRLSTIKTADRVLVLERGRIVEEGDPSALLAADSVLRRLASGLVRA